MENASEAIKMAVAGFIFLIALATAMIMFSRARATSTSIIDNSGIQSYYESSNLDDLKIVGVETIIPTLYSYFNENVTVLFYRGSIVTNEKGKKVLANIQPLPVYFTEALKSDLDKSNLRAKEINSSMFERAIYGFDNNDEMTRKEPWTGSDKANEEFINDFVSGKGDNGTKYYSSVLKLGRNIYSPRTLSDPYYQVRFNNSEGSNTKTITNILKAHSLSQSTSARFVQRVGNYNYDAKYDRDENNNIKSYNVTDVTKSLIQFDNDETIENRAGNIKRVIQFIYIGE